MRIIKKINELKADDDNKEKEKEKLSTTLIDNIGVDLTKMAEEGKLDPVIGRKKEIDEIVSILSRRRKNNPVLIGDPGVGKTAIVEGLAQIIKGQDCPEALAGSRLIGIDMASLMMDTAHQGDLEKKIKRLLKEVADNPEIVLFIDEIHMLVDSNKPIDVSNMFKPALARGEIRCIGATTDKEYKIIEKDGALERRFQKIKVNEPSKEETLEILKRIKKTYEDFHNVKYTDDALSSCVSLSGRYITDRFFPDKAIDLLDEIGARMRSSITKSPEVKKLEAEIHKIVDEKNNALKSQDFERSASVRVKERDLRAKLEDLIGSLKTEGIKTISREDVKKILGKKLNLPQLKSDDDEYKKYIDLESNIKMDIIGQDEAIKKVSKYLRRTAAGLKDPNRPAGIFLFLGSTGVGKTQTVKALAKNIFGSESDMIRVDMSEFSEKHTVSRLIGAPPSYVGYGEGGQLTEKVRKKPYSIILLDEIEKAHPNIFNIFLQVFEDGHLTDGEGKKVDFKNTIIIMTSNVGSKAAADIPKPVGFGNTALAHEESTKNVIGKELQKSFPPEFLNRIDDIIIFKSLSKDNIYRIIDIELVKLKAKLKDLGHELEITENLKDLLIENGYDETMGARPLKRAIVKYIEEPISEEILRRTIKGKIVVDYDKKAKKVLINGSPIIEKRINTWNKFKP